MTPGHFVRAASLYTVGSDGRGVVALTRGSVQSPSNGMLGHYDQFSSPSWSPDGSRLVYTHYWQGTRYDYPHSELAILDADGTDGRTLTTTEPLDFFRASSPAWSPAGNQIASVADDNIWVINPDGSGLTRLTNDPVVADEPAWSPDGSQILFVHSRSSGITHDFTVMNADGSGQRVIASLEGAIVPTWSPDGTTIAFSATLDSDAMEIYAIDSDGGNLRRLTKNPAQDDTPAWTPDGKSIVFRSTRGGSVASGRLWIMNADGSNQRLLIPEAPRRAANGQKCTITGTDAADQLDGTPGKDVLCGLGGIDGISGNEGNDVVDGGPERDVLVGGSGNDLILARDHRKDAVRGGTGFDRVQVDGGVDKVSGVEKILR